VNDFGIPDGQAFSTSGAPNAAFLNQWSTNGGGTDALSLA